VKGETVRKWKARDRIPPEYWAPLIVVAQQAGHLEVTAQLLAEFAAKNEQTA
jgi:hypothetical protein